MLETSKQRLATVARVCSKKKSLAKPDVTLPHSRTGLRLFGPWPRTNPRRLFPRHRGFTPSWRRANRLLFFSYDSLSPLPHSVSTSLSPPPVSCSVSFPYYFPLSFSQFKMAALSSAESPPPVFNGDTMDRDPERERGLDELGAGLDTTCTGGIPECQQDIPEEVCSG